MALCRNLIEKNWLLNDTKGIVKYIQSHNPNNNIPYEGKEIYIYPFIHPSHNDQNYKKHKGVEEREKEFEEIIKMRNKETH